MGVLIAFLALGAGLLGSLFPDEIKVAFPFVLWPSHPWIFAPYAFLFWFCVLGWLSLYLVRLIVEGEYLEALKTQAAQLGTNVKALGGTTGEIHQNVKNASESAVK
jgi:tetrahydromethanopterin S-methyltransferase subunit E